MTGWLYRIAAALWLTFTLVHLAWVAGKNGHGGVALLLTIAWVALGMAAAFAAGVEHEEQAR